MASRSFHIVLGRAPFTPNLDSDRALSRRDAQKETSPHIVLIERVIDDPVARFGEIGFFYRLPSAH